MESKKNKHEMNNQDRLPGSILVLAIELDFYFSESLSENVILWCRLAEQITAPKNNLILLPKVIWLPFLQCPNSHSLSFESLTKSAEKCSPSTFHPNPVVWPELIKWRVRLVWNKCEQPRNKVEEQNGRY